MSTQDTATKPANGTTIHRAPGQGNATDSETFEGVPPHADEIALALGLRGQLAGIHLLAGLPPETLDALSDCAEWLAISGGTTLFEAEQPADALYCVLSGSLGIYPGGLDPSDPHPRPVAVVRNGETLGEMSLLAEQPTHQATVVALRDSELARFPRVAFELHLATHPGTLRQLAGLLAKRLTRANHQRFHTHHARTFALLPQSTAVDIGAFAVAVVAALDRLGRTELVWDTRGAQHTAHWFNHLESGADFVVYVGDAGAGPWSHLCARQADTLLLVARAEAPPGPWAVLTAVGEERAPRALVHRAELVLLHPDGLGAGAATRWLADLPPVPHHHIVQADDVARLARLCTGHALGLVLGGGGARGFAHLGVLRALRRAGVTIDLVGGTSMGALLAAGIAKGWDDTEMRERFFRSFVHSNPLTDYTMPFISLVSGRRVGRRLRKEFGDEDIADLRLPFFCVSANLSAGCLAVHQHGSLSRWLRASIAIPGILPPVSVGGELFVDGGSMNNLPVDIMRTLSRGPVIGVDVGADRAFITIGPDREELPPWWRLLAFPRERRALPNIFRLLWRAGMVSSDAAAQRAREQSDLLLQPTLESIDLLDWASLDRAADLGEACAEAAIEAGALAALLPRYRARG